MYKNISFVAISFAFSLLAKWLDSSFISTFAENQIALLTTLLAINIASSSLIAGKLRDIQDLSGHNFANTKKELKRGLIIQVVLIGISFVLMIMLKSKLLQEIVNYKWVNFIGSTITVGIFIYYLDTVVDLGKALISLLEFETKENDDSDN